MFRLAVLVFGLTLTSAFPPLVNFKPLNVKPPAGLPNGLPGVPLKLDDIPFVKNFGGYMKAFNKTYSGAEQALRNTIFQDNIKKIVEHNKDAALGKETYTMGVNFFSDMTADEVNSAVNGFEESIAVIPTSVFQPPLDTPDLKEIDWRKSGLVTPVKNQGLCASCWAFSTVGSIEGQHKKKTGNLVTLSEQHMLDCSVSAGNRGCDGGTISNTFQYIKKNGINKDSCYEYEGKVATCRLKDDCTGATVTDYVNILSGDEDALKKAVTTVGPISAAIDARNMGFRSYEKGVYYDKDCDSSSLNHGVLVVGYGTVDGHDYWIVKNSWGQHWGEEGYIRMARNKNNHCGISTRASYPLV